MKKILTLSIFCFSICSGMEKEPTVRIMTDKEIETFKSGKTNAIKAILDTHKNVLLRTPIENNPLHLAFIGKQQAIRVKTVLNNIPIQELEHQNEERETPIETLLRQHGKKYRQETDPVVVDFLLKNIDPQIRKILEENEEQRILLSALLLLDPQLEHSKKKDSQK